MQAKEQAISCQLQYSLLEFIAEYMTFQLENEFYCIKHCWGISDQKTILDKHVCIDDWTGKWANIASSDSSL